MFGDLGCPLNASRGLSAIAEIIFIQYNSIEVAHHSVICGTTCAVNWTKAPGWRANSSELQRSVVR